MMVAHQNGKNRSRDAQWPKLGGNKQQKRQIPPVTKRQIPPVSVTESSAPPQKKKLRIPKDFPKGICFRFCLGFCSSFCFCFFPLLLLFLLLLLLLQVATNTVTRNLCKCLPKKYNNTSTYN